MSSASEKVIQLRQLLAERFGPSPLSEEQISLTGLTELDEIGVPRGALTEVVSSGLPSPGGSLLLYALVHAITQKGDPLILIDGKDTFAPKGLPPADLQRLLWMRCRHADESIKAADLAIRDGNIPWIILLLTVNPWSELRHIPPTAWHRLQMLAEKAASTVLIFSPQEQVGCARLRLAVSGAFPLEKLHARRSDLLSALVLRVERRRIQPKRRNHDEDLRRLACA